MLFLPKCAIIINNAVKCWNRPWQYGCNRPNALPSGRAFFVYRYGGDSIAYCFLSTLFEDSELEFPFIIDSPTGKMDFEKRQAIADIIPLVFNQMIAFVQSAEVERFADRFYANPDSQYLTVVASPQDQAVVVYEGIDFFDSYQREHKGDEK